MLTDDYPMPEEFTPEVTINEVEALAVQKVENCTDLGNARRLVREFGAGFIYAADLDTFFVFDGKRWAADSAGTEMMTFAKKTAERLYLEGCRKSGDAGDKLKKFALESESLKRLKAMLELAKSEPEVVLNSEFLDRNPLLLNVQNGTIDLGTGRLRAHNRDDLLTKISPVEYPANASGDCPAFRRFLGEIFHNDKGLLEFIQRASGYFLTGETREQKFFYCYGTGANGKSTWLNVLGWLLGPYAKTVPSEIFMARDNNGGATPELAQLPGVRLVISNEVGEGRRMDETFVKASTGGEVITARQLYKPTFEFLPAFKPVMAGNHKPEIRGTDTGIWRRIVLIPFTVSIPVERQDKRLPEKLKAELPEILRWSVQGCVKWQREGLAIPSLVEAATNDYRSEMDVIGSWLTECCTTGGQFETQSSKIYNSYREWATANGFRPSSQKKLSGCLKDRGFKSIRKPSTFWLGIGLNDDYSVASGGAY